MERKRSSSSARRTEGRCSVGRCTTSLTVLVRTLSGDGSTGRILRVRAHSGRRSDPILRGKAVLGVVDARIGASTTHISWFGERKSVVMGKSVSTGGEQGGGSILKKN